MSTQNKPEVVVITGASAGIGRATARAFAREGAHIGLLARGRAGLEGAKRDVESLGGKALVLPTNVADPGAIERAADAVEKELGPIDIWVNDAMCSVFSPFSEIGPEEFKRVTEVTYLGFVYGTMAALKRMRPRNRGTIIQVGSALAYRGIPLQSAYCGAKHAIQGFTESVRCELLHDNCDVKLTMVQMPAVNTPQFDWVKSRLPHKPMPVPPIYQPEVAADAIVWAARHYRREWYVGGTTAFVIPANKVAPGLGDHYLADEKHGFASQQHDGPPEPGRRHNLFDPVDNDQDHGAHGVFDDQSSHSSVQLALSQQRGRIALGGLVGGIYLMLAHGASKFWRGSLIGMTLASLAAMGTSQARIERRFRSRPRSGIHERPASRAEHKGQVPEPIS
jgi:NAD(P)-dependent dehydrogenase (short-subunit alcohol dehydrogenase family)